MAEIRIGNNVVFLERKDKYVTEVRVKVGKVYTTIKMTNEQLETLGKAFIAYSNGESIT